jgi:hypothetical protein
MPTLSRPVTRSIVHMGQVAWARDLAQSLLAQSLPRRWAHSRGVAAQAAAIAPLLGPDADLLVAAAWVHDIGYAPDLAAVDFHPLDGARYLRDEHAAAPRLCGLVAHHTCATFEAEERGLLYDLLIEFPPEQGLTTDALIYCDMTTGPDGRQLTDAERLSEIFGRYEPDHPVHRAISRAAPCLRSAVAKIELLRAR